MELNQRLSDHINSDNEKFARVFSTIDSLAKTVENIRDNHLHTVQDDITSIKSDMGGIKTDMEWVKKSHWVTVSASVSSFLALIGGILLYLIQK